MELCEEKLKEYLTVLGYREEVQDSLIKFAKEVCKLINQITEFLYENSINNQMRIKANKEVQQEWRKTFKLKPQVMDRKPIFIRCRNYC
ncbi:MAG: hypothetical protein ACLSAJ_12470 [Intestinibacter bartlettii]|uniref:hypothetical protein n=1 Tax=Intestinibacter bartlettii TaxID=261299 RepID=UPI0039A3EF72